MLLHFGQSWILTWMLRTESLSILCCYTYVLSHLLLSSWLLGKGKGFWTRNRFAGDLGSAGNSWPPYPINRACCFPPAARLVVTDMWTVTSTDRCWQVSNFLGKNAWGRMPCKKLRFAFQVTIYEHPSMPLNPSSCFGHLLFNFLSASLYHRPK